MNKSHPHSLMTALKQHYYGLTLVISLMLIGAVFHNSIYHVAINIVNLDFSSFSRDGAKTLHEEDPVFQVSKIKIPVPHLLPGQKVIIEVTDLSNPKLLHPFYFQAVVKNGFAYCDLSVGNPQDAGRVFKIRGLAVSENAIVPLAEGLDTPISGDVVFGPSYNKRQ